MYGRTSLAECAAERSARWVAIDFGTELAGLGEVLVTLERDLSAGSPATMTVVLDNLDTVEREGDDFGLLVSFISNAREGVRFVLCSISTPAFLQQFPPHEVLTFGADDLSFTGDECARHSDAYARAAVKMHLLVRAVIIRRASMSPETTPLVKAAVACAYAQLLADTGQDAAAIALFRRRRMAG